MPKAYIGKMGISMVDNKPQVRSDESMEKDKIKI